MRRLATILLAFGLSAVLTGGRAQAQATASVAAEKAQGEQAYDAKNYREAMRLYLLAADQGDSEAQERVGWMYDQGLGVPQDYTQAIHWHLLAADQGDASAQDNLGEIYYYGHSVPVDYAAALHWYSLAAAKGDAAAEFNLGWMYFYGTGVAKDEAQGRIWMNSAGAQNLPQAVTWLAQNPK